MVLKQETWYPSDCEEYSKIMYKVFPENTEDGKLATASIKVMWVTGEVSDWIHPPKDTLEMLQFESAYNFC